MDNYYSRKFSGIGYAINFINSKKKTILDDEASTIRERNLINNQNILSKTSREGTVAKIIGPVAGISAPIAGSKLKKIFNIYKNNKNIEQSKNNENENDDVEAEGEEPNLDFENESELPGEVSEIQPRPMTDAEIDQFADPFERESQNTTSRLNFDDVNENPIGESEVGEMEPTETPQLTGFSKMVFGESKTSDDFTPDGSTSAGYAPEGESGGYDVGVELDPATMNPLQNVGEVADEAPEVSSDFQSILDMANAPKSAQVVSFGDAEPASAMDPDIVYGGNSQYDISSFGRSAGDMASTQFGGDSTIARMNNWEDMNPAEQYESHADDVSTFGDAGDVANIDDVSGVGESGEAVSSTVGEVGEVAETAEAGTTAIDDVVEGLGAAEVGVDAVAIGADSTAAATAAIPIVDIVTATVGAVATVAAIGTSVGLGIASAIQSAQQTTTAQQDQQISNIPAPQTNIAGRYLGGRTSNLYPSSEQNY